jgi:NAD(P)-dependent dehydrogenase (short-subunit alcohol dehydrogenase family)
MGPKGVVSAQEADHPAAVSLPLLGRHALVTGGGRGIGAAIASRLAALGADLTLVGRTASTLHAKARRLATDYRREVTIAVADVTDAHAVARAFETARAAHGAPHILVNNAGGAKSAAFLKTDHALWDEMLRINLKSAVLCTEAALPAMLEAGWGRIVNVASTAGLTGYRYVTAYCAAKHALVGFTRSLARELAGKGVTVNAVCPGYTDTDLTADAIANIVTRTGMCADAARAELAKTNPQGRLIEPSEVANAVAWLCLPESGAMTGQAIAVAGGEVM